jgi:hypothetical protein
MNYLWERHAWGAVRFFVAQLASGADGRGAGVTRTLNSGDEILKHASAYPTDPGKEAPLITALRAEPDAIIKIFGEWATDPASQTPSGKRMTAASPPL